MADRKSFLLRIDAAVLEGIQRWADDDLRSVNAQVEFLLRDALRRAGRLAREKPGGRPGKDAGAPDEPDSGPDVA